jgi:erythromycin esterase
MKALTKPILVLLFAVPGYHCLNAQQLLNLGFEKLSAEGIARPWGWSVYSYAQHVNFTCDTSNALSGSYSLKINSPEKDEYNRFELSYFIEPNQILNSRLVLEGWAQTDMFSGKAGIRLSSIGPIGGQYSTLTAAEADIANSDIWTQYKAEITIDMQPHSVLVTLYYSCTGTIWFDNLILKVNGEPVQHVPVAPQFDAAQLKQLASAVEPFTTVEPTQDTDLNKTDFSDLQTIKSLVGDARIIALGESTHGTAEFFKVKHRLLQYAITELGVRVFVLEDNQLIVERINEYVLYGTGTAENVIKGLFAVWNTEEMLALITWLRSYNIAHPDDMVEFVGMDTQNPQLAIEHLDQFLARYDTAKQQRSNTLIEAIRKDWRNSYFQSDSILMQWDEDAELNYKLIKSGEDHWLRMAQNRTDSMDVHWAIKNARTIKQFTETLLGGIYEGRDKAMAENIDWILTQRKPGTKIIVWAHDSHVSRGDAPDPESNFFFGQSMGSYLSKQHGDDYYAFGLFTYYGSCLGTISYSNFKQQSFDLYTSPEGTIDAGLHKISRNLNSQYLILNLKQFKNKSQEYAWINIKRPVRYVGYVAEDYGFGGRYRIPYQFDAVIYVDRSSATIKPISKK